MSQTNSTARICPTRIDGESTLFAHQVSKAQCQARQRDCFHKCFTCVNNNAYVAAHGEARPKAKKAASAAKG